MPLPGDRRSVLLPWLKRVVYGVSLLAFFLPFAALKGCEGEVVEEQTGFDLIALGGNMMLVIVFAIGFLLFTYTFRRLPASRASLGSVHAAEALLCAAAGASLVIGTLFSFLFLPSVRLFGFELCVGCWTAAYALCVGVAVRCLVAVVRSPASEEERGRYPARAGLAAIPAALLIVLVVASYWSDKGRVLLGSVVWALAFGAPLWLFVFLTLTERSVRKAEAG